VNFQARAFRPGGDVITKVGGKPVEDSSQLAELISAYEPGDEVPVEVHRGGDTEQIEVKLGERPLGRVGG
jgi:S1-C subfamily serine protease